MTQPNVLQFVIVGQEDHPLYEADLAAKPADAVREVSCFFQQHFQSFTTPPPPPLSSLLSYHITNKQTN
jgi:hypothetical protein